MIMEPNPTSDHIHDWIEDSVSFFPSFFDDPYNQDCPLWDQPHDLGQFQFDPNNVINTTNTTTTFDNDPYSNNLRPLSGPPKKRNGCEESGQRASSQPHKSKKSKSRHTTIESENNGDYAANEGATTIVRKSCGNKKSGGRANGSNSSNNGSKDGRWAEQLLNPCATAIAGENMSRVQHLLYVLHELASLTGDANHRLAAYGLYALKHHLHQLSNSAASTAGSSGSMIFAKAEPRFFQKSLLKFYEVSPWFSFPNNIANASILQVLADESDVKRTLHIVDIGVSHGVQWPTFLEALSRRPGGPPPLVRLTVVNALSDEKNEENMEATFSLGPPGDNFSSRLLGFAQSINVNLQINKLDDHPLQTLNAQSIDASSDETLIVCAQFRLHQLNHNNPDERGEFMKNLRDMRPKGVILSENNMDCCCENCGNYAAGFSQRVEYLWRFLDSTSSAFKGRESDERRMMEGEAAKALTNRHEMNEGKEKWCQRMKEGGFKGEVLEEDAIDGARALLRKYDNNWEMKIEDDSKIIGLWWKGQPVSFCSLWKLDEDGFGKSGSAFTSHI